MKIDQQTLKTILNCFVDSPRAFVWVADILELGLPMDDSFLFHMQILEDRHLIECLDGKSDLGYEILLGGEYRWNSRPLRLTAEGHEFIEAMNRPEIWDILKQEFQDASIATLKSAAGTLLKAFAEKQLAKYLDMGR